MLRNKKKLEIIKKKKTYSNKGFNKKNIELNFITCNSATEKI